MLNYNYLIKREHLFQQITGLSLNQFNSLLKKFTPILNQKQDERIPEEKRERKAGGGRKSKLGENEGKLFFILFYYRNYPTLRFAQLLFELEDSNICYWVHFLSCILFKIIGHEIPLPERKMRSFSDLYVLYPELKEYIVDGTERNFKRSKDNKTQEMYYSGKKKRHTIKNQVFINPYTKKIIYATDTFPGSIHDKTAVIEDGVLEHAPPKSKGLGDLAYLGIEKDKPKIKIITPIKKKSKQPLSLSDKQTNKTLSQVRVRIEHVIGKLKINKILKDPFRSNIVFSDLIFKNICCLYNFKLAYTNEFLKRK